MVVNKRDVTLKETGASEKKITFAKKLPAKFFDAQQCDKKKIAKCLISCPK